jgi:predicted Fe-Mo cluster-binding NifX family protein
MGYEAIPNPMTSVSGPAAEQFINRLLQEYRVKFILAGGCGCTQLKELSADGMRVLLGMTGSVREAVEKFNRSPFLECCDSY